MIEEMLVIYPIERILNILFFSFGCSELIPFSVFFYPAGGINKLLFSGEKRMTIRTDLQFDLLPGRSCCKCVTTCTGDGDFMVFGMNSGFHRGFPPGLFTHRFEKFLITFRLPHSFHEKFETFLRTQFAEKFSKNPNLVKYIRIKEEFFFSC